MDVIKCPSYMSYSRAKCIYEHFYFPTLLIINNKLRTADSRRPRDAAIIINRFWLNAHDLVNV